jgi:hypothetical protein
MTMAPAHRSLARPENNEIPTSSLKKRHHVNSWTAVKAHAASAQESEADVPNTKTTRSGWLANS